jgi:glutathione S-transferase
MKDGLEVTRGSGSPNAWRVLLAAEMKNIPYTSKLIEFSGDDLKKPDFLAINPRGKVPVIRDGNYSLYESLAIMAYLERRNPKPARPSSFVIGLDTPSRRVSIKSTQTKGAS